MAEELITGAWTLWELLEQRVSLTPDRIALQDERDRSLSFAELRKQAIASATQAEELGIAAGAVVSWQLPTRISTVVLSAALCRIGVIQNPIIPQYRRRELEMVIRRSASSVLVVPEEWRGMDFVAQAREVRSTVGDLRILVLGDDGLLRPASDEDVREPGLQSGSGELPSAPGDSTSWIYCTSGTSAEPKGVRHSDRSMIAGTEGWVRRVRFGRADVAGVGFPWAHAGGTMYLAAILIAGAGVVLVEHFDPPQAVRTFVATGTTVVGGSTVFYQAFLDEQRRRPTEPLIPTLRMVTGGAAPMPPDLYYQVKKEMGLRILHGYGSTEAGSIAIGSFDDDDEALAHTVGRPISGIEVKVERPDGTPADPGEDGELLIGGEPLFLGYTDESLNTNCWSVDGLFRTGDMGHFHPDGRLVVTGRIKDIIIRKGENVSAQEVEEVLFVHPKVASVAVIGLPDQAAGERVCAVVELVDQAEPLTFDEMIEHFVGAGLMRQKFPEQLELIEAMPRNSTYGKIAKNELRARYA